jgi:1-deoxy-D-xylulose-5-phosphate reductoisomerase
VGVTRGVAILGSTGSIGTQALDDIARHRDRFRVVALAAGRDSELLARQADDFDVPRANVRACANEPNALAELAALAEADVVLNAVVGFAGLPATMSALEAGKRLALANKESLIAAGPVVAKARAAGGGEIVPVDSEHSAIYQCLRGGRASEVRRIVLTASGGPFRGRTRDQLTNVSVDDALAHPTWNMGAKITIDSSTLMNKGLEVIEAHELFGVGFDAIDVVVHPQSIIHSMVEFHDGATLAQLSQPDMRLPIGLALAAPERWPEAYGAIDWRELHELTFEVPDLETFQCLALAYEAGRHGGTAPAILSAANEVAVEGFLSGRIGWFEIAAIVEETLLGGAGNADEIADVLDADRRAREAATDALTRRSDG